jgi:hypothetical protein
MPRTLYTPELENSTEYYIYYPKDVDTSMEILKDKTDNYVCSLFELFMNYSGAFRKESDQDFLKGIFRNVPYTDKLESCDCCNWPYFTQKDKYIRRYPCSCYKWVCEGCTEDGQKEIRQSLIFPVNKRFILESILNPEYMKKQMTFGTRALLKNEKIWLETCMKFLDKGTIRVSNWSIDYDKEYSKIREYVKKKLPKSAHPYGLYRWQ